MHFIQKYEDSNTISSKTRTTELYRYPGYARMAYNLAYNPFKVSSIAQNVAPFAINALKLLHRSHQFSTASPFCNSKYAS